MVFGVFRVSRWQISAKKAGATDNPSFMAGQPHFHDPKNDAI
jgi:hypothetical protein